MAGTNTEQPANKAEQKKIVQAPVSNKKSVNNNKTPVNAEKKESKQVESQKTSVNKPQLKIKRDSAKAYGRSLPISTKVGAAICKFVKNKTPKKAIEDLQEVTMLKKAIPMKGEIPHRKGNIMSGRFPQRAAENFLVIVRNLASNADQNDMDAPVIAEAIANKAQRPYGKGGRWKRKRTHITLVAREKKVNKQNKKNK